MRDGSGPWSSLAELLVEPLGTSGIRGLNERGLLDASVIAAHCVTVDEEEIAILVEHDVAVVHCPRSNGYLGCGIAPLAALRAAGLRVSVGTDSPASTPSFDMFEELRAALTAARFRERDAGALLARDLLRLATLEGARVLSLDGEIGSIVPGKQADLVVVSLDGSPLDPAEDPAAAVVLGGSPDRVLATLVAGEERYRKGTTAWRDIRRAARSARSRMIR
jgi:5-methylthioadenosine/S-adenosylhomocysteine deaminase